MMNIDMLQTFSMPTAILSILILLLPITITSALDNGLGLTPPMGWNSWNHFRCDINETLIRNVADALVSTGLKDLGYEYLNLDDCWQVDRDPTTGKIIEDPIAFPSGMKALGDYIHSKGLKFGLYSDAGQYTCQHRPGSLGKEEMDAKAYAAFGCDYLKYDNCYSTAIPVQDRYVAMRDALNATGRPIYFSMCEWGYEDPATWASDVANSWRTTGDIFPRWNVITKLLDTNDRFHEYAGPGGWNDPDMIEVGNGNLTVQEERSHFTLWAMMKAPLLLGNDVTQMTSRVKDIIGNRKVIAINQDPLGVQAYSIWSSDENNTQQIFAGPLDNGGFVVAFFNRNGTEDVYMTVHWKDIPGIPSEDTVMFLEDLWCDLNTTTSVSFSATVQPRDVVAFRMTPVSIEAAETYLRATS